MINECKNLGEKQHSAVNDSEATTNGKQNHSDLQTNEHARMNHFSIN